LEATERGLLAFLFLPTGRRDFDEQNTDGMTDIALELIGTSFNFLYISAEFLSVIQMKKNSNHSILGTLYRKD
jgi:hypothetical protein